MNSVKLAIYAIRITEGGDQRPLVFDKEEEGTFDLFDIFKKYLKGILKLPQVLDTKPGQEGTRIPTKVLTLVDTNWLKFKERKRYMVGEFYLGTSDDNVDIVNFLDKQKAFKDEEKDKYGYFRRFFYYLYVPHDKKIGYIVVQKAGVHGMKTDFGNGFRKHLRDAKYLDGRLSFSLTQITNEEILENWINTKTVKEFKLIRHNVPISHEKTFYRGEKQTPPITNKGQLKLSYEGPDLSENFRDSIKSYFKGTKVSKVIELGDGIDFEFDEIGYTLEINGKPKKFSMYRKSNMRSDRDVTDDIKYDESRKPTLKSLIEVSEEMIRDFRIPE